MKVATYRDTLRDLSFDNHGVVTLRDAAAAGVPDVEVRKLASRGALRRIGQGVYRMEEAPTGQLDEFAEAVALVGDDAVLADEAVLVALGVGIVNPRKIRVATPHRVRRTLPPGIEVVHRRIDPKDIDNIDGIPAMTLRTALLACRGRIMPERLVDATREAVGRHLLGVDEARQVEALVGKSGS